MGLNKTIKIALVIAVLGVTSFLVVPALASDRLTADFKVNSMEIEARHQTAQFTDLSTGGPISWNWDFDNNGIVDSTEQNPAYIYRIPGIYTVKLTVTNAESSDDEIKTNYISVSVPEEAPWLPVCHNASYVDCLTCHTIFSDRGSN